MSSKIFKPFLINIFLVLFITPLMLAQEQSMPLTYENEEFGIKLTGPYGWYIKPFEKKGTWKFGYLVWFLNYPLDKFFKVEDKAVISLELEPAKKKTGIIITGTALLEKANLDVMGVKLLDPKSSLNKAQIYYWSKLIGATGEIKEAKIIERPSLVKINNQEAVRYICGIKILYQNREQSKRTYVYIFLKGDYFFRISYDVNQEHFDKYLNEFEQTVKTLVLK